MSFFFWLAAVTLAAMVFFGIEGILGARRIRHLDDVTPLEHEVLPSVSLIIPALNEEEKIEEALLSVLSLDYARLEIIAINDRSTDSTGSILEEMHRRHPRLKVMHIDKLPPDWLGKNHALHCGAQLATGEFLLFTDADVVMERTTLKRAVSAMIAGNLDHLTLFFKAVLPASLLRMVVIEFGVSLVGLLRPWKVSDPDSPRFIGIGAFNLVKATKYRECGGHEPIRLCPLDDIMLGKLLKIHGSRQECLYGYHHIRVKWYGSIREMTAGLTKNTFAALDYSVLRLCVLTLAQLAVNVWPFWALLLTSGPDRLVNGVIVLLQGIFFVVAARYSDMEARDVFWFPVTPYIRLYMTWKAVLAVIIKGGITWRGTFYPLDKLKAGRLRQRRQSKCF
ncbi:MAG: glycosyltransferase family 2 protein [Pseudomonadota bacterium]